MDMGVVIHQIIVVCIVLMNVLVFLVLAFLFLMSYMLRMCMHGMSVYVHVAVCVLEVRSAAGP